MPDQKISAAPLLTAANSEGTDRVAVSHDVDGTPVDRAMILDEVAKLGGVTQVTFAIDHEANVTLSGSAVESAAMSDLTDVLWLEFEYDRGGETDIHFITMIRKADIGASAAAPYKLQLQGSGGDWIAIYQANSNITFGALDVSYSNGTIAIYNIASGGTSGGTARRYVTVSGSVESGGQAGDLHWHVDQTVGDYTDVVTINANIAGSWSELAEIFTANQNNVYRRLKDILQQGTNSPLAFDDTNSQVTVNDTQSSGGSGLNQAEVDARVRAGVQDWAETGNNADVPDGKIPASITRDTELTTGLAGKSNTSHNHDTRYFTEGEVTTSLAGKSNTSHLHDSRYYTESEVDALIASAGGGGSVTWVKPSTTQDYTGNSVPAEEIFSTQTLGLTAVRALSSPSEGDLAVMAFYVSSAPQSSRVRVQLFSYLGDAWTSVASTRTMSTTLWNSSGIRGQNSDGGDDVADGVDFNWLNTRIYPEHSLVVFGSRWWEASEDIPAGAAEPALNSAWAGITPTIQGDATATNEANHTEQLTINRIGGTELLDVGGPVIPGEITRAEGHALPAEENIAWNSGQTPPVTLLEPLTFDISGPEPLEWIGLEMMATGGGGGTAPTMNVDFRDDAGVVVSTSDEVNIDGKVRYYQFRVVNPTTNYHMVAEALGGSDSGDFTLDIYDVLGFSGSNKQARLVAQVADRMINLDKELEDMGITQAEAIGLIDQLVPPAQRNPALAGHGGALVTVADDASGIRYVAPSEIADDVTAAWAQPGQPEPSGGGGSDTVEIVERLPHPTDALPARAVVQLVPGDNRSRLEIVSRAGGATWNGYTFVIERDSTAGSVSTAVSIDGRTITISLGDATRTIRQWADLLGTLSMFTSNGTWHVDPWHYANHSVPMTSNFASVSGVSSGGLDAADGEYLKLTDQHTTHFDGGSGGTTLPGLYRLEDLPTGMAGGRFRARFASHSGTSGFWLGADYPAPHGPADNFGADVFIPSAGAVMGMVSHVESGSRVHDLWLDEFMLYSAMNDIVRYHWKTDQTARADEGGSGVINPHDYNVGSVIHYGVRVRMYAPTDLTTPAFNGIFALTGTRSYLRDKDYRLFRATGGSADLYAQFVGDDFVEVEVTIDNSSWAGVHLMRDWVSPLAQADWGSADNLNQTAKTKAWRAVDIYEPSIHQLAKRIHDLEAG